MNLAHKIHNPLDLARNAPAALAGSPGNTADTKTVSAHTCTHAYLFILTIKIQPWWKSNEQQIKHRLVQDSDTWYISKVYHVLIVVGHHYHSHLC